MAEKGSRTPASNLTALQNILDIEKEGGTTGALASKDITQDLRRELLQKGLKGFNRGGTVPKTGIYKLHKDEEVIPAGQAKKSRRQALYGKD